MGTYARVRSLAEGLDREAGADLGKAVERIATATRDGGEHGALQLSLSAPGTGTQRQRWTVALETHRARVGSADRPDVEILTSVETFWRLVDGSYSPVDAFRDGKLRIRGDAALGKRVLRHLAGPDGKVDC